MFGGLFGNLGGGFFNQNYRAYPVAFIEKSSAEKGDKVILPPSALQTLASMHVQYPMLFRVTNRREGKHSHCGVLEFVAQEGMCYMPQWVMNNLLLTPGDLVNLQNVSLPKGTFIKIQPHTSDFLEISNPKAVLETSLRSFTCLTKGDTFVIDYNGKNYEIDVLEVKPDEAVSVIETDVNVDFAAPKDYQEPDYAAEAAAKAAAAEAEAEAARATAASAASTSSAAAEEAAAEPQFMVFSGSGNRLDGKAAGPAAPVAVPLSQLGQRPSNSMSLPPPGSGTGEDKSARTSDGARSNASSKTGKVVFGDEAAGVANNRLAARLASKKNGAALPPPAPKAAPEAKEPGFVAFGGKGRSLKD